MKTVNSLVQVGIVGLVMVLAGVWSAHAEWASIQRVIDGDTFVLTDGTRVRVKGIDTPETKHPGMAPEPGGEEATQFAKATLEGRTVWLDGKSTDKYHRRLAAVEVAGMPYADMVRARGYDKLSRSSAATSSGVVTMPYVPSFVLLPTVYDSVPAALGQSKVFVRGYTRANGTYVQPYYRSAPRRR